ncbi:hypothetical protein D9M71_760220 [compost metagenome]
MQIVFGNGAILEGQVQPRGRVGVGRNRIFFLGRADLFKNAVDVLVIVVALQLAMLIVHQAHGDLVGRKAQPVQRQGQGEVEAVAAFVLQPQRRLAIQQQLQVRVSLYRSQP